MSDQLIPMGGQCAPRHPTTTTTLPPSEKEIAAALKTAIRDHLNAVDMYPIVSKIVKELLEEIIPRLDFKGRNIQQYVEDLVAARVDELLKRPAQSPFFSLESK